MYYCILGPPDTNTTPTVKPTAGKPQARSPISQLSIVREEVVVSSCLSCVVRFLVARVQFDMSNRIFTPTSFVVKFTHSVFVTNFAVAALSLFVYVAIFTHRVLYVINFALRTLYVTNWYFYQFRLPIRQQRRTQQQKCITGIKLAT